MRKLPCTAVVRRGLSTILRIFNSFDNPDTPPAETQLLNLTATQNKELQRAREWLQSRIEQPPQKEGEKPSKG
jgi:hypothetical protein